MPADKANINNKKCSDKFIVEKIKYDENKVIIGLSIKNATKKVRAFVLMPPKGENDGK